MFFKKQAFLQEVQSLQKKIKYAEDQREIYRVELEECRMQLEAVKSELVAMCAERDRIQAELCAENERLKALRAVRCDSHTRDIIENLVLEIQAGPACNAAAVWLEQNKSKGD
jgi:predicted  nucleic acid-binding Zn-ribbon protein